MGIQMSFSLCLSLSVSLSLSFSLSLSLSLGVDADELNCYKWQAQGRCRGLEERLYGSDGLVDWCVLTLGGKALMPSEKRSE